MNKKNHIIGMTIDESKRILRRIELEAFSNLVTALRAQGFLTSRRKKLLEDASNIFNISIERHKAEIRRAVNDECLSTIADLLSGPRTRDQWEVEGRRLIPLIPRAVPQTAFTAVADQATPDFNLPIPTFILPNERVTIVPIVDVENSTSKEPEQTITSTSTSPSNSSPPSSPPVKKIRLKGEKIDSKKEKDYKDPSSEPKPSTSSQKSKDNKKNESKSKKSEISKKPSSSQFTDKSILTEPSTSSGISRSQTNSPLIPFKSIRSTSQEKSTFKTIEAHSKGKESTKKSSIKETTAPLTSSSESAASPKPAADQATKRNVLLLQTKSNSQRNITIPQETFKKLISAGTQTNKPLTIGSIQKININHPTQGKMIVVDLSQQQPTENALVNEILQASGLLTAKSPAIITKNPSGESKEEAKIPPLEDISKNSKIDLQNEEQMIISCEPLAPDPNIDGVLDFNVPEAIQYEETMEELIETEVLDGMHSMNIVGEIDPITGLYSTIITSNTDNFSSSDVSN